MSTTEREGREDVGVLFADIADSSRLYHELGDDVAKQTVVRCLDLVANTMVLTHGRVVDRIGDEVMGLFPNAAATLQGAVAIQRAIQTACGAKQLPPRLSIRIGCHWGPVLHDGGRVFGYTVYVARRVATLAKAQQVLTTRATLDQVGTPDVMYRALDQEILRGRNGRVEIIEILWDDHAATLQYELEEAAPPSRRALVLSLGRETWHVCESRPAVTIGRGEGCDVVVAKQRVSRLHVRIEMRKAGFFLIDLSTNGTRVTDAGGAAVLVKRDETRLTADGIIHLGPDDPAGGPTLRYSIEQESDPATTVREP